MADLEHFQPYLTGLYVCSTEVKLQAVVDMKKGAHLGTATSKGPTITHVKEMRSGFKISFVKVTECIEACNLPTLLENYVCSMSLETMIFSVSEP